MILFRAYPKTLIQDEVKQICSEFWLPRVLTQLSPAIEQQNSTRLPLPREDCPIDVPRRRV
ncbi:MAG TPA: hypothetical protein V6D18_14130 [Thermosynechococcaceae cyanobacterium]